MNDFKLLVTISESMAHGALGAYYLERFRDFPSKAFLAISVALTASAVLALIPARNGSSQILLIVAGMLLIVVLAVAFGALRLAAAYVVAARRLRGGRCAQVKDRFVVISVRVEESEITYGTATTTRVVSWGDVLRIVERNGYWLLMLRPTDFLLLPLDSLECDVRGFIRDRVRQNMSLM